MSTPRPPDNWPDGPAADDDMQDWLDLLAGRSVDDASAATRAEATRLRHALQAHLAEPPPGAPSADEERLARLLGRARAAGVLPPGAPTATSHIGPIGLTAYPSHPPAAEPAVAAPGRRRPNRQIRPWSWAWAGALAAGVALLVLGPLLLEDHNEPAAPGEVLRGPAIQQLPVANPVHRRDQMLAALRAAGLDAQPFERLGRLGLDIALPVPLPAAQAQALAGLGIAVPDGPSLVIELLPAAPTAASAAR